MSEHDPFNRQWKTYGGDGDDDNPVGDAVEEHEEWLDLVTSAHEDYNRIEEFTSAVDVEFFWSERANGYVMELVYREDDNE